MKGMKRSRDIIISKILDVCTDGAHKTKIVYQANLNFRTVNPYLELLIEKGMINAQEDGNLVVYETTAKGLALLDNCKQIQLGLSLGAYNVPA
jgi:predicted transcriptional regulator